jgi:hypothetical protein
MHIPCPSNTYHIRLPPAGTSDFRSSSNVVHPVPFGGQAHFHVNSCTPNVFKITHSSYLLYTNHILLSSTYPTSCRMNTSLSLLPEHPISLRHMIIKPLRQTLKSPRMTQKFYRNTLKSSKKQIQPFGPRSLRRPWERYTSSDLQTHLSIRKLQARYVLYLFINVPVLHHMIQKIQKWFYNHYMRPRRHYTKFTRKWSARNAFYHLNRDEVLKLANVSGIEPGDPDFLGALQNATTTLWNKLSPGDQDDYAQAAKEWSEDTPPRHIQSRCAIIYIIFNHLVSFLPIEWHHPCASGSSRTFRVNFIRHVVFTPWFLLHMRVKIITSKLACKSFQHILILTEY